MIMMKRNYQTTYEISLKTQKAYLYQWIKDETLLYQISLCMHEKQLKQLVKYHEKEIYMNAKTSLYQSKNYEILEKRLIIMNTFFDNQDYDSLKKDLFHKLQKQPLTLETYCVYRHLISNFHFYDFMFDVGQKMCVSLEECAKICVIEDEYKQAYYYLSQLETCDNEVLLDLICSYSLLDYMSLKRRYKQKQREWVLQPIH